MIHEIHPRALVHEWPYNSIHRDIRQDLWLLPSKADDGFSMGDTPWHRVNWPMELMASFGDSPKRWALLHSAQPTCCASLNNVEPQAHGCLLVEALYIDATGFLCSAAEVGGEGESIYRAGFTPPPPC